MRKIKIEFMKSGPPESCFGNIYPLNLHPMYSPKKSNPKDQNKAKFSN